MIFNALLHCYCYTQYEYECPTTHQTWPLTRFSHQKIGQAATKAIRVVIQVRGSSCLDRVNCTVFSAGTAGTRLSAVVKVNDHQKFCFFFQAFFSTALSLSPFIPSAFHFPPSPLPSWSVSPGNTALMQQSQMLPSLRPTRGATSCRDVDRGMSLPYPQFVFLTSLCFFKGLFIFLLTLCLSRFIILCTIQIWMFFCWFWWC